MELGENDSFHHLEQFARIKRDKCNYCGFQNSPRKFSFKDVYLFLTNSCQKMQNLQNFHLCVNLIIDIAETDLCALQYF